MTDAALDDPVCVFAQEFLGVGTGIWVRRAVGITFECDSGYADRGGCGKPLLNLVIRSTRLWLGQAASGSYG